MNDSISIINLSEYFSTFVSNFQELWVIINTTMYTLFTSTLPGLLPDSMPFLKTVLENLGLLFSNYQDLTVFNMLLGGFATFFISFILVKFLLDLVT